MSVKITIPGAVAGLGTVITAWLGGWDAALQALIFFIVLDYITGIVSAIWLRRVDSNVMFKGGIRKLLILGVVAAGVLLDHVFKDQYPFIRTMFVYFYVAREGLSVVENLGKLGVPVPQFLVRTLTQLQPYGEDERKPNR